MTRGIVLRATGIATALFAAVVLVIAQAGAQSPLKPKPVTTATTTTTAPAPSVPAPPPFGPSVTAGQTLSTANMTTTNPLIPADIYRNTNPTTQDLATFAWLSFISAVSPVSTANRGTPGGSFASSGANASATLVWETYQHRSELLPYSATGAGVPPQTWNSPPTYVESVTSGGTTSSYSPGVSAYNNLDETTQIGQNILLFPLGSSPSPATDAQVLFEAKVNQYEWQFVNTSYANLIPKFNPFHFSPPISLPNGTVEVKAAWRPLSSIPQNQQYRYHTANVITYTGSDSAPTAQLQQYALIALHIIHKTPNYPAFIFATFEQVDDFTNQVTNQPSGVYYVPAYSTISYSTETMTPLPPYNTTVTAPTIAFNTMQPTANPNGVPTNLPNGAVTTIAGSQTVQNVVAVPVTQPDPAPAGVNTVNAQALAAMKQIPGFGQNFVWQYYKLAGVQAVPTNDDTTDNFYLANIVVESSQPGIQLFRGQPIITGSNLNNIRNRVNVIDTHSMTNSSMGGCQGCHGVAQTQNGFDFSFLFFGANGGGFQPETIGVPGATVSQVRLAKRRFGSTNQQ